MSDANSPLTVARYGLTDADRQALRRAMKGLDGAGSGTAPRPKRRRVAGGGGGANSGGIINVMIGYAKSAPGLTAIPAATAPGGLRSPGLGTITVKIGDGYSGDVTNCENWSFKNIAHGAFCLVIKIDGHHVVATVFC